MKRRIPYAVMSYEEVIRENYYFVDKTEYIRELEPYKTPVFLRPRRFGKSLWCSTLECYYDINRKNAFGELFGKTAIGRNPTPSHNSMLTLRLDFSCVDPSGSYADIERKFNFQVMNFIERFCQANRAHANFSDALKTDSATSALTNILGHIQDGRLPPLCIIIDEYDNFTNQLVTANRDTLYYDITTGDSFLRTFFKTIKFGVGNGSIGRVFITGVLPITIDDLTSGFNIAQVVSLQPKLLSMMGFTQAEAEKYVGEIFADYGWDRELLPRVMDDLKNLYDGYRLLPGSTETLYNSTIFNFYLSHLVINDGTIPTETIDDNVQTDIHWVTRLAGTEGKARELLSRLMTDGTMAMDSATLRSKFNMRSFFSPATFPVSLYYLGLLTFQDEFTLCFPNLTVKTLFASYFDTLEGLQPAGDVLDAYVAGFRAFLRDRDWGALFSVYWKEYIGQIPAQAFDRANENFFRTTFYALVSRFLRNHLTIAIETNLRSGRCDFQAIGRLGTPFVDYGATIEFKYYKTDEAKRLGVLGWAEPPADAAAQARSYAADLAARYPELKSVAPHVVCIAGTAGFRFFTLQHA